MRSVRIAFCHNQAKNPEPPNPLKRQAGGLCVSMPPHAAASNQKHPEPLPHVVVDLSELPGGVPGPKVVPPAPQHGVQPGDQDSHVFHPVAPRIGELPNASPKAPHAPRRRPTLQEHPAGIPYRPTLPEPTPEKLKALLAPRKIHQPRLLRMRLQPDRKSVV